MNLEVYFEEARRQELPWHGHNTHLNWMIKVGTVYINAIFKI